jgi:hypothetical protein
MSAVELGELGLPIERDLHFDADEARTCGHIVT